VGFSFAGDTPNPCTLATCEARRTNWGLSMGTAHGIFGFEEDVSYIKDYFGSDPINQNAVLTITSNIMLQLPKSRVPVQPYAVVGLAFIRPHATLDVVGLGIDKNALGYDVGGGVTLLTQGHVGLRSDLRRIRTFKDLSLGMFSKEQLDYWRGSLGLTLRF